MIITGGGTIKRKLLILISILAFSLIFCGAASAATINVNNGTGIQNAINGASNGDTLNLSAGTYKEHDIVVNKNLTIIGPKPSGTNPPTAVVDAQQQGYVFKISPGIKVALKNLLISNGYSGIYNNGGDVTLTNSHVCYNKGSTGGGIYNTGNMAINNSRVYNNVAVPSIYGNYGHGGGIFNTGNMTITDSYIFKNNGTIGAGIYNYDDCNVVLVNSSVYNNIASNTAGPSYGGGIYNWGNMAVNSSNICYNTNGGIHNDGVMTISISNVYNNTEGFGGIYNNYGSTLDMDDSDIFYNNGVYGGGIRNDGGNVTLFNSHVFYNTAYCSGGGIYNTGNMTITNSDMYHNNASGIYSGLYGTGDGGGIYDSGSLKLANSNLYSNTAKISGGGIYSYSNNVYLTNSNIYNNKATNGGGILVDEYCSMILNNSNVYNNIATTSSGGGIYNNIGTLTITNSSINNNSAPTNDGGAIYNAGTVTITNSNFYNNTAINGGAICTYWRPFTMTGTNLYNNIATGVGGGIYNKGSANVILNFCRIIGNSAPSGDDIYNTGTLVDATLNWWGSNQDPSSRVQGSVTVTPWLVLNVTANPSTITAGKTSSIIADLLYDSNGGYHDPAGGHLPDGTPIRFTTTLGTISGSSTSNGIAKSTLNSGTGGGTADISTTIDSQAAHTFVTVIDTTPPIVMANPRSGSYNTNKIITLTMSEPGNIYYTLNGATPTSASARYIGPITVSKTTILKFIAIDKIGYHSIIHTEKYTIDRIPPKIISTYPKKSATKVSRTSTIIIKFSENIKTSTNWSKIYVKAKNKKIKITKYIKGNKLYIKTKKRLSNTYYSVYIPKAAIKDASGNKLAKTNYYKFKTRR